MSFDYYRVSSDRGKAILLVLSSGGGTLLLRNKCSQSPTVVGVRCEFMRYWFAEREVRIALPCRLRALSSIAGCSCTPSRTAPRPHATVLEERLAQRFFTSRSRARVLCQPGKRTSRTSYIDIVGNLFHNNWSLFRFDFVE